MKNQSDIIENCYEGWLKLLFDNFFQGSIDDWQEALKRLDRGLVHAKRCRDTLLGLGEDLILVFKENRMSGKKLIMAPVKRGSVGAVMPGVKWSTISAGIAFVVVDANGTPVGPIDPTTVTTTLAVNDASGAPSALATEAAGADALSYKISRTAATGNIVLAATLAYNAGSPGPFTASLPIELDALVPGAPTDLTLTISGN